MKSGETANTKGVQVFYVMEEVTVCVLGQLREVQERFFTLMYYLVELGIFVGTRGSGWHNAQCCLVYFARLHHPRLCVLVKRHPGGTIPYQWAVAILNCFFTPLAGMGFQSYMRTV